MDLQLVAVGLKRSACQSFYGWRECALLPLHTVQGGTSLLIAVVTCHLPLHVPPHVRDVDFVVVLKELTTS